ncbi:MAG: hypothetical protein ACPLOC_08800 [Candidatus Bathyarchaeales archaeon]
MTKQKTDWYSLPPLQKQILLHLALKGAKTRNEVAQELGSAYKNVLFSFNSLKKKGLIKQVGEKKHRQRKFPYYWLSEVGIILAFMEGASKDVLFEKTKEFYPNNETLNSFIEFASVFTPDVQKIAFASIKSKGKLEIIDLFNILFIQMEVEPDFNKFREALNLLKKYPKACETFKQNLEIWNKVMSLVSEVLGP